MKLTKRQVIEFILFSYGTIVSFSLTGYALLNLNNFSHILTLILFLPVFIYFLYFLIVFVVSSIVHTINSSLVTTPYFGHFSFSAFFNQSEFSFLINILLITLAFCLILLRISLNIIK